MLCNIYGIIGLIQGSSSAQHNNMVKRRRAHYARIHIFLAIAYLHRNDSAYFFSALAPYACFRTQTNRKWAHFQHISCAPHTVSHTVIHYNDSFFSGIFKHFQWKKHTILNEKKNTRRNAGTTTKSQLEIFEFFEASNFSIKPPFLPSFLLLHLAPHHPATPEWMVEWAKLSLKIRWAKILWFMF